jgi:hypothetical protein
MQAGQTTFRSSFAAGAFHHNGGTDVGNLVTANVAAFIGNTQRAVVPLVERAYGPMEVFASDDKNPSFAAVEVATARREKEKEEEEEKGDLKRAARTRKLKGRKPTAPAVDSEYFDAEYKKVLLKYWTTSYNEDYMLQCLTDGGAKDKRGSAFRKFVRTLYDLGKEYLSPENFEKYEGKLFKWECKFSMPDMVECRTCIYPG